MNRRILAAFGLSLIGSGCGRDLNIGTINHEPEAQITSHADGSEVVEGEIIVLVGKASDIDTPADVLASWYAGGLELCPATPPDELGASRCETALGPGEQVITLEVQDPSNIATRDSITMFAVANEAPEVVMNAPRGDGSYYSDELITFEATVVDKEDTPEQMSVSWENQDGDLNMPVTPLSNGQAISSMSLEEGEHQLTVFVTDSGNKVGTDTTTITVGPPNSAPTCGITSPSSGDSSEEGSQVAFAGTASDVDVTPNLLSVEWSSDKDGVLGSSTPNSSGDVAFLTSALSAETHTITMMVTDEVGASCTDFIPFIVGTAPSVVITSPVGGASYIVDQVVSFSAQVNDQEDLFTDLSLEWTSDLDGLLSTQGADSQGEASFSLDTLSLGLHVLTVTATDTSGISAQALVNFQVVENTAPSVAAVTVSPDPVYVGDTLTCNYSGYYDADGHGDLSTYSWKVDGSVAGSASSLASGFAKGETVKCVVTPFDGFDEGTKVNDSVVVSNTLPSISSVSISPASPTFDDTLTCGYSGFVDADSDSDTSTAEWFIGGVSVGTGSSLSGVFSGGDEVTCIVTPKDGEGEGLPVSGQVTIENSAPSVAAVSLSPNPAMSTDLLSCNYSGYADPDGDVDQSRIEWSVEGAVVATGSSTLQGVFGRSDEVTCAVIPFDGMDSGTPVEASLVITNQTPEVSVMLTPSTIFTEDSVTAVPTTSDVDGDAVTVSYVWKVNGVTVAETSDTLDGATSFDRDDVVKVKVTPNDGEDDGPTVTSSAITVSNTPPSVASAAISPSTPTALDSLSCGYSFDDLDGDSDGSSIEWTINGGVVSDPTGSVVRGDTVGCTVTADDGTDSGNTSSASVVIGNSAPVATDVSISPDPGATGDTLSCSYSYSDADGDADQSDFLWQVNGSNAGYSSTLSSGFARGDTVSCIVGPDDGTTSGTDASDSIVIGNAAPTIASVSITPDPAGMNDDLSCGYVSADLDGDSVTVTYLWEVNGSSAGTGMALSGPFLRGDVVECTVTPDDGLDLGPSNTGSLIIGNTAPTITSVSISPDPGTAADTLTCNYGFDDVDGDSDGGSSFSWTVEGAAAGSGATLSGAFAAGETVACEVTPDDGVNTGVPVSGSLVVNTAPLVSNVLIDPNPAIATDDLTCSYTYSDADGHGDSSSISWTVDSNPAGVGATLLASAFSTGSDVSCFVTANDGSEDGNTESATLFINGPPVISDVTISPNPATASDSLDCIYTYTDAESDPDQSTVEWSLNGVPALTGPSLTTGFVAGDLVECTVYGADDYSAGNTESDALTINTPPSVASAALSPDPIAVGDDVDCVYTFDDPDPLDLDQSDIEWFIDGGSVATGATLSTSFVGGETVWCEVTPFDGAESGLLVTSPSLRVNQMPSVSNVQISPDPAYGDVDLNCSYAYDDPDFDIDQSLIEWRVNGFPVGTDPVLPLYEIAEGDDVVCEVTPYDGINMGTPVSDNLQVAYTEREHCGVISQDETWEANAPHLVTCTVEVYGLAAPTLTIEDGAVVRFQSARGISVGQWDDGRLVVDGHTQGVQFLSDQVTAQPGDWGSVRLFVNDQNSSLTGLTISHGGGSNVGSVFIQNASPTLDGVEIYSGNDHGIEVIGTSSFPLIKNSIIQDNLDVGVYISGLNGLDSTVSPSFTNNIINGNYGEAMVVPPAVVAELSSTSSFAGNGAPITIRNFDKVEASATWRLLDEEYLVDTDINVRHASGPVLTIEDGVTLRFTRGKDLAIGQTDPGTLIADGGPLGIRMTAEDEYPASADHWKGVYFYEKDGGSVLTNVTLENGGYNGAYDNLHVSSSSPTFDGVISRNSLRDGIRIRGSNARPLIQNTQILDNDGAGIYCEVEGGLADGGGGPSFVNNVISGNSSWAVSLFANDVGQLDASSSFTGNGDDIRVDGGHVEKDAVWQKLDVDYFVEDTFRVDDVSSPSLTIEDGVTLLMGTNTEIQIGKYNDGRMVVDGHTLGVVFTSAAEVPTPGDWYGVLFDNDDTGSQINGLDISYGGKTTTTGQIKITSASPTITNTISHLCAGDGLWTSGSSFPTIQDSTFMDNWGSGLDLNDPGGLSSTYTDPVSGLVERSFQGNLITGNNDYAIELGADAVHQLHSSTSISGNDYGIKIEDGSVSTDASWLPFGQPYVVGHEYLKVQGPASPTLTIEDGVELRFASGYEMDVGYYDEGRLIVDGHTLGVLMTSDEVVPAPGDWNGLKIFSKDMGSTLLGLTVEYAGGGHTNEAGLYVNGATVSVDECTVQYCLGAGMYATTSASVDVADSVFRNNAEVGLRVNSNASLTGFSGSTVNNNGTGALTVNPGEVGFLDVDSVIVPNDDDVVFINAGGIETDTIWRDLGVQYRVSAGTIKVEDTFGPTLTIEDGVEVYWEDYTELSIGRYNPGRLVIHGDVAGVHDWDGLGEGNGVLFTSGEQNPAAGDWKGIGIYAEDLGSEIIGLTMEYGGISGQGAIHATSASPRVGYSSISDAAGAGITGSGSSVLEIYNTTIANADGIGVNLSGSSSELVKGTTPSFVNNDIYGCSGAPLELGADFVGQLDSSSSYAGNGDRILIRHGEVSTDATWQLLDEDFEVQTALNVEGVSAPALTIEDGVNVYFSLNQSMRVGLNGAGSLHVDGTSAGVEFTSAEAFPEAGDWYGLRIENYDQGSVLEGLEVNYGGNSYYPGLWIDGSSPVLDKVTVRYSDYQGIRVDGAAAAPLIINSTVEYSTFDGLLINSAAGLAAASGPSLSGNTFRMNGDAGLSLPARLAHEIDDTNVFSGNDPAILLSSDGMIQEQVTWLAQTVPYTVSVDLDIAGTTGAELTLDDGVEVAFLPGRKVKVGSGVTGSGALRVEGDIDGILDWDGGGYGPGVLFTSSVPSPASVDLWGGIEFRSNDTGSELFGLTVENAGPSHYLAAVLIEHASPLFDGVIIKNSDTTGLRTQGTGPSGLVVRRSQIIDNLGDGLDFGHLAGPDVSSGASFTDNVVSGNMGYAMQIPGNYVGALDASSTYAGNGDRIRISSDELEQDAVWQKLDEGYLVRNTVDVKHATDPVLTIEDGVNLYFETEGMIRVGYSSNPGQLVIDGHTEGVLVTSAELSPAPGDFHGIVFGTADSGSFINGLTMEYGSRGIHGSIASYSSLPEIQDSTVRDSEDWGIYVYTPYQMTLTNMSYSNNADGDLYMP
jgi:hypothetical protein